MPSASDTFAEMRISIEILELLLGGTLELMRRRKGDLAMESGGA